jgi:hypothetical protein
MFSRMNSFVFAFCLFDPFVAVGVLLIVSKVCERERELLYMIFDLCLRNENEMNNDDEKKFRPTSKYFMLCYYRANSFVSPLFPPR